MNLFRPRYHIGDILKFTGIVSGILTLFSWSGADRAIWPRSVFYRLGIAVVCALSLMRRRMRSPQCQDCGRPFSPAWHRESSGLCPYCRVAKAPPQQRRRLAAQGFVLITVLLMMLSFLLLHPFAGLLQARLGILASTMIAIGLFVTLFLLLAGVMLVRFLVRKWRLTNPGYALRVASACAREVARQTTFGPISVYIFGPDDPTSMLESQLEICRDQFEWLVDEQLEVKRPPRFFVFGSRASFNEFFRCVFFYRSNLDGMYIPWSTSTISITTEFPAYRLADPERLTRVLLGYYFLDSYRKGRTPLWLQVGTANLVACGGDEMELARLNRKMLAALSRGTALGTADLFHLNPTSIITLVRDWQDFKKFSRYTQLIAQSWSVVEFLCSQQQGLEQFRAFLGGRSSKAPIEEVFNHHFYYGFEILLERWRSWVLNRGIGLHESPPLDIRDALLGRLIPMVQDHEANQLERIQAIREMGRSGYVLGADALIEALRSDDQIPAEEVVWSLESISGLALGDNVERWADWFDHLPKETVRAEEMAG